MWRNYPELIKESEEELRRLEKAHRGKPTYPRIAFLRLLKSGEARSIRKASEILGYSQKQLSRWWGKYQNGGLEELLRIGKPPGKKSMMTQEAWQGLMEEMKEGKIRTLKDAQRYLSEVWDIHYKSLNGIWVQFKKRKVKLKTGRRRHRKADENEREEFKKNSLPS